MRFHHVGLSVADLEESRKWYAGVLGFTEGFAFEIGPIGLRGLFMHGDGIRVELLEQEGSQPVRGEPDPGTDLLIRGYGHFALATAELDADFARLVAAGATPVWHPRQSPEPGVRMAFIADIDGNLIELVEGK
jgi:lactoylglutathione lyase